MSNDTYAIIGLDGELERYPDTYRSVTNEVAHEAAKAEDALIVYKNDIEVSFLKMGMLLSVIDEQQLYLGRGYDSMKTYANDPALQLTWPMCRDLLMIVRDGVGMIGEALPTVDPFALLTAAGVTKVRACLPLLKREELQHEFAPLVQQACDMTVADVKAEVKRLRGQEKPIDVADPAVFKAQVEKGENYYRVRVICRDGVDVYPVGILNIKPQHFGRFDQRFGAFIEFVDAP